MKATTEQLLEVALRQLYDSLKAGWSKDKILPYAEWKASWIDAASTIIEMV